jgi:sorting nexin-1/2
LFLLKSDSLKSFYFLDLAVSTKDFAKSAAVLAHAEEHINLAKALSQLGDLYEKVDELHVEQAHSDFFTLGELLRDYIGLLDSVREVFDQRIKVFQNWQKAEETLKSKQDTKAKLELGNKQDKIPTVLAEIRDVNF